VREEFNIEKCLPSGRTQGSRSIPELLRFDWEYAPIAAPYRIYPDLPEEYRPNLAQDRAWLQPASQFEQRTAGWY
jgi:hypothetical protein